MTPRRPQSLILVTCALVALAGLLAATAPRPRRAEQEGPAAAPQSQQKTASEVFKNIQVLKNIPASQLIPTMQYITVALGVGCDFCHVEDRSLDVKPHKATARKMMIMLNGINQQYFNGRPEVACYTCHKGRSEPQGVPAVFSAAMAAPPPAPPSPAAAGAPSTAQIFANYVQALGGADAIQKITSRVEKGSIERAGGRGPAQSGSIEVYQKAPDKILRVLHSENGQISQGFNGNVAWTGRGTRVNQESGAALAQAKSEAAFYRALNLGQEFSRARVVGTEDIDGRPAYRLFAFQPSTGPVQLFFDTQSGLLVRTVTASRTPLGALPQETDYADYRAVDGVQVPFTVRMVSAESVTTYKFDQVTDNVPIDDARFDPPESTSAAPPSGPGASRR